MASVVNPYEVVLKIVHKETRAARAETRTEYAYGPTEAMMQAVMNASAELDGGSDVIVTHVGPPQALVVKAARDLEELVARAARDLGLRGS